MYETVLRMKFQKGFWLGYAVGAADMIIVWTVWTWRHELLDWMVG